MFNNALSVCINILNNTRFSPSRSQGRSIEHFLFKMEVEVYDICLLDHYLLGI